jgi:hypothetical protein
VQRKGEPDLDVVCSFCACRCHTAGENNYLSESTSALERDTLFYFTHTYMILSNWFCSCPYARDPDQKPYYKRWLLPTTACAECTNSLYGRTRNQNAHAIIGGNPMQRVEHKINLLNVATEWMHWKFSRNCKSAAGKICNSIWKWLNASTYYVFLKVDHIEVAGSGMVCHKKCIQKF